MKVSKFRLTSREIFGRALQSGSNYLLRMMIGACGAHAPKRAFCHNASLTLAWQDYPSDYPCDPTRAHEDVCTPQKHRERNRRVIPAYSSR